MITFTTKRLLLRPIELKDLNSTHAYASSIENAKYMVYLPNSSIEETKAFLTSVTKEWQKDNPNFYEFAIILDNQHIGCVSLYVNKAENEAELGWILHRDYWGNGYMIEAALKIKEFALGSLQIKKLFACCDYRNEGSYKVMEKLGMTLERTHENRYNKNEKVPSREFIYALHV